MNSDPNSKVSEEVRQEKHHDLNNAINRIDELTIHAGELLQKITNTSEATERSDPTPETPISLHRVLSNGPSRIHEKINEIHSILDQIHESIF